MSTGVKRIADRLHWVSGNKGLLGGGYSSYPIQIRGVTRMPIQFYFTSALATGTLDLIKIDHTQTVAATSGYIKGIRCTMNADVKTPGSFNAIKGIIDYKTSGYPHGDCAPLASELTMPNSSASRGSFAVIEGQIAIGASSNWTGGPASFIRLKMNGTVLKFEEKGFILDLQGFGAATAGEIFDDCTAAAASHALKIQIGTTPYYIMLQSNVDA